MKTQELLILGAVGLGAYLLMTRSAQAGTVRAGTPGANLTNARPFYIPANQLSPAQQQANQLQAAQGGALYGIGSVLRGWFGGSTPSYGGAGGMTGSVRPSTDYGVGTYSPPDTYAVNPPESYTYAPPYDDGIGTQNMTSADRSAIYGNDGYGFYTQ